jgi:hypothetical protein
MIDFEYLKKADIEVVNSKLTAEDKREISEFLKAYRAKEDRSKKACSIPSRAGAAARKRATTAAK